MRYRLAVLIGLLGIFCPNVRAQEETWKGLLESSRTLAQEGDEKSSLQQAQQALRIARREFKENDPRLAQTLEVVAQRYLTALAWDQAKPFLEEALSVREKAFGSVHATVAQTLILLGDLQLARQEYAQAQKCYQRALTIREKLFGATDLACAETLIAQAKAIFLQAREIRKADSDEKLRVSELLAQSRSLLERALEIREKALGKKHLLVADVLVFLAEITLEEGQAQKAQALATRALHIQKQTLGPEHPIVAETLIFMAKIHLTLGKTEDAAVLIQEALSIQGNASGRQDSKVVQTTLLLLETRSHLEEERKKTIATEPMRSWESSPEKAPRVSDEDLHPFFHDRPSALDSSPYRTGERNLLDERMLATARSFGDTAETYIQLGRYEEAAQMLEESIEIYKKVLPADDPAMKKIVAKYAELFKKIGNRRVPAK